MIVETIIDYDQLSCRLKGVPCRELASDRDHTYPTTTAFSPPFRCRPLDLPAEQSFRSVEEGPRRRKKARETPAETLTTYGQVFFFSSLSTLSSNTEKWMWATKSACTKTKNTGTPRNTRTLRNTLEQRNSLKTLVHRTKFDGVVWFSYYRPCKIRNVSVISLTT